MKNNDLLKKVECEMNEILEKIDLKVYMVLNPNETVDLFLSKISQFYPEDKYAIINAQFSFDREIFENKEDRPLVKSLVWDILNKYQSYLTTKEKELKDRNQEINKFWKGMNN